MAQPEVGPIVKKLLKNFGKHWRSKVVEFESFARGKAHAEELQKSAISRGKMAEYHPTHSVYIYAQHQASILSEILTGLPELKRLADMVEAAEDEYMPSGPPMSPLTRSYFFFWAVFDASVGAARESIGDCVVAVSEQLGVASELLKVFKLFQRSRMGLFLVEEQLEAHTVLRELITHEVHRCAVPSGCRGKRGSLWLARVLPPPFSWLEDAVVMTTPYIILGPSPAEWQSYLARTLPRVKQNTLEETYTFLMKYGLEPRYWPEYIFEAYANFRSSEIYLTGLPDVDESRPHSKANW